MKQYIYFDGKFVPEEKAMVSVKTHALQYGTGIFEGIRAYYNEEDTSLNIFRMREHFERMKDSAKILFIDIPHTVSELCDITETLLQKNFVAEDMYIRPFAFKATPTLNSFDLRTLDNSFAMYTVPMGRYLPTETGIRVNTASWQRIRDQAIPPRGKITGTYVNTALAKTESLIFGFDEALFLDNAGHVVEGSTENLFLVKNGAIYTPSIHDDILIGITRNTVIKLCKEELGIIVEERSIDRSEIYQADELFLVGTGAEVAPVINVDGHTIGNGQKTGIAKEIRRLYGDIVRGKNKKYLNWVTKVTK